MVAKCNLHRLRLSNQKLQQMFYTTAENSHHKVCLLSVKKSAADGSGMVTRRYGRYKKTLPAQGPRNSMFLLAGGPCFGNFRAS
ncbi:hypothetical protein LZ31DRAFT_556557 [Colletotrichum somersetense]|nr:hypothetical protein LZ31DRAFT_556557 [Colletotrichum somersetense]